MCNLFIQFDTTVPQNTVCINTHSSYSVLLTLILLLSSSDHLRSALKHLYHGDEYVAIVSLICQNQNQNTSSLNTSSAGDCLNLVSSIKCQKRVK